MTKQASLIVLTKIASAVHDPRVDPYVKLVAIDFVKSAFDFSDITSGIGNIGSSIMGGISGLFPSKDTIVNALSGIPELMGDRMALASLSIDDLKKLLSSVAQSAGVSVAEVLKALGIA